jgi:MFS family permease
MTAPEVLRGRVVSLYATLSLGTTIFGSLFGGIGATYLGAPMTILIGGALTLAMGAWAWRGLSEEETQSVTPPLASSEEAAIL